MKKKNSLRSILCILAAAMLALSGCSYASVPVMSEGPQTGHADETVTSEGNGPGDAASDADEDEKEAAEDADTAGEEADAEEDIPALRDIVASDSGLGADSICAACIGTQCMGDERFLELIRKHFNAVTLENELKPDALFGYSNNAPKSGSIHDEELGGSVISVPELDFSRADAILDRILEWNGSNPGKAIRARGHVLVWHSQTPEWFFHEGYDAAAPYVSKEEMDRRLEWYIKSVLTHYTSEGSRYEGMFYGWDVVNEAVSDRGGMYRSDIESGSDSLSDPVHSSKSSWWKVYGSSEYIVNAFRYANKYAPAGLDLYYNDYNECDKTKMKGIMNLITEVKSAEGTRLDGFGMQGHYSVNAPAGEQIADAVAEYAALAGKVMITELDVKPSMFYDGSDEGLPKEFIRQGKYYRTVYEVLKEQRKLGACVAGITFWGASDKYSWLADKRPLPFDEDYRPKPAYWAFADPAVLSGMEEETE
ncbi:MAG: endo-1,4-beta-xylanase [Lachnospiraceae bacterium]|nr:endo-1,4-beta-xylanase [Lachnospiraceae bacterium]